MIPEILLSSLKEKLSDASVKLDGEDVNLFKFITEKTTGLYDKSEAYDKIKVNNDDLVKQRDDWKKEKQSYDDKLKAAKDETATEKTKLDALKAGQLTDEQKKEFLRIKESGMTDDTKARMVKMEADLKAANENITSLTTNWEDEKEKTKKANQLGAEQKQNGKIVALLAKQDIPGDRADDAIAGMRSKGYVKLENNDDGVLTEKYRIFVDGSEAESTLDKMVETYSKEHEYLKKGTSSGGTGSAHNKELGNTNEGESNMSLLKNEKGGYD